MLTYGAFFLGAACMLWGFYTVVRGIGAGDSDTDVKMFGIEISASKLGPGLVFSVLGLILVLVALFVQPKVGGDKAGGAVAGGAATPAPAGAESAPATATAAVPTPQPASPAMSAASMPAPASQVAETKPKGMSHEEVAALVQDTLSKIQQGYCPQANLEPLTLAQCNQGLPVMAPSLAAAGPIHNVSYYGEITIPTGRIDQYMVVHQNLSAIWKVTVTDNRKLSGLWTGPPP